MTFEEAVRLLAAAGVESPRTEARWLWQYAQTPNPPLEGGSNLPSHAKPNSGRGREDNPSPKFAAQISTPLGALGCTPVLRTPQGEGGLRFTSFVERRLKREPFAYIVGRKEFWSMDFAVGPGVLVPRPETETLIEEALKIVPERNAPLSIADLGAGSGAILTAALTEFPQAIGVGYESSPQAHAFAAQNLARLAPARGHVLLADWSSAPDHAFDLVFSNPPYIPSDEIDGLDPEVSRFEPRSALDGGADGLAAYRALAGLLPRILRPGGHALLEIGAGQGAAMELLFRGSGLFVARMAPDLAGIPRALVLEKEG